MLFSTVNGTTKKVGQEAESEPLMMPWSHQALLGDDHDDEYEYDEKPEKKREVDAFISGEAPGASSGLGMFFKGLCAMIWGIGVLCFVNDKNGSRLRRVVFPRGHIDIGEHYQLKNTTLAESNKKINKSTFSDYSEQFDENTNKLAFILKGIVDQKDNWQLKTGGECKETDLEDLVKNMTNNQLLIAGTENKKKPDSSTYSNLVNQAKFCGVEFSEGPRMLAVLDKNFLLKRFGPIFGLSDKDLHKWRNANRTMLYMFWILVGFVALVLCFYLPNAEGFPAVGSYIATIGVSVLVYVFFGFAMVDGKLGGKSPYYPNPAGWNLHKTLLIFGFVAAIGVPLFLIILGSQESGKTFFYPGVATVVLSLVYFFFGYGFIETQFDKMDSEWKMYAKVSVHCLIICLIVGFWLITACKYLLESNCAGESAKGFEHTPMLFGFLVIIAFMILSLVIPATVSLRGEERGSLWWSPAVIGFVVLVLFLLFWLFAVIHVDCGADISNGHNKNMARMDDFNDRTWHKQHYAFGLPMWVVWFVIIFCVGLAFAACVGTKVVNDSATNSSFNSLRVALCGVFVVVMLAVIIVPAVMDDHGERDPRDVACAIFFSFYALWAVVMPLVVAYDTNTRSALSALDGSGFKIVVIPFAVLTFVCVALCFVQMFKPGYNKWEWTMGIIIFVLIAVAEVALTYSTCDFLEKKKKGV